MGFGFGNWIFELMFTIVPLLFIVLFVYIFVRGFKEHQYNKNSPRLTVWAKCVVKRYKHSGTHEHHTHTNYYATFEVESGDRMELAIYGTEFGLIAEGDEGMLTFQGRKFISFARNKKPQA